MGPEDGSSRPLAYSEAVGDDLGSGGARLEKIIPPIGGVEASMDRIFGTDEIEPVINGARYKLSHRASVIGILGDEAPPVSSRGEQFYNTDRWTARFLVSRACKWAADNPGCVPTRSIVARWVSETNAEPTPEREIVIAETPDVLPFHTALALTGGGYHEALHTYYSARRDLNLTEVADLILPRWAKVKDWAALEKALLDWSNIIEDIRIERLGCTRFEAIYFKMCDLQDFILDQEESADTKAQQLGKKAPNEMGVIARTFRDLGLGYDTDKQRRAYERYTAAHPEAVALVKTGPLHPLLQEAINLTEEDDLGSLRIALDVLVKLAELGKQTNSDQQAQKGQTGDGKQNCPSCGAAAPNIIVRPKSNGQGGQTPGKGIATCTQCGFQQEVNVTAKPSSDQKGKGQPGPKFLGFGSESLQGLKSHPGAGQGKPGQGSSKGSGGSANIAESQQGSDQQEASGASDQKGPGSESNPDSSETRGQGAGGHHYNTDPVNHDWSALIAAALQQANQPLDLLDNSKALQQALSESIARENDTLRQGEAVWRPYDTNLDQALLVPPSHKGKSFDLISADIIIESVREETAYLRSRLRTVIRSMEQVRRVHGVKRGRILSSRYMVDSKTSLLAGQLPSRAYTIKGEKLDMSMAAAVVLDESVSMNPHLTTATRIMVAIVEPLDEMGFPTLALGIRNGMRGNRPHNVTGSYHRFEGVVYDVFKRWGERFRACRWRFANTRATGGTPLSDGIQYALKALSDRNEAHRFMFVVTDGAPNHEHRPVIRRQIRLAREAGITIIGVGIGEGTQQVVSLFDDYVWTSNFSQFPHLLLQKINEHVDIRAGKRGVRVQPH